MLKAKLKAPVVRRFLARKNRSQNWLARKMEISSGYLSQMLNGTRNPSPRVRERIMDVFEGNDFDDLFIVGGVRNRR